MTSIQRVGRTAVLLIIGLAAASALFAPRATAGAPCTGCAPCACGEICNLCDLSGTGTQSATINQLPFFQTGSADAGCLGNPSYTIDTHTLPFTATVYNATMTVQQIPVTLTGTYATGVCNNYGECTACGPTTMAATATSPTSPSRRAY